jgi:hypothetical protein
MTDPNNVMAELGNVVVLDDDASARAITEAAMRQTARRYGIGGDQSGPITEVGGARAQVLPLPPPSPPAPYRLTDQPPAPLYAPPPPAVQSDHLLLTPSKKPGQLRVVRMQGSHKLDSWTIAEDAAHTIASILSAFGVTLTDLRESEDSPSDG